MKIATVLELDDITSFFTDIPGQKVTQEPGQKKTFFKLPPVKPSQDEKEEVRDGIFAKFERATMEERRWNRLFYVAIGAAGLIWPAILLAKQLAGA